ncbi:hypothetical protein HZA85_03955 [Candidatus Uhrbacteria bacterium]|nr:hypothetical protein [Candidatus Uhrbacteria bacterium]
MNLQKPLFKICSRPKTRRKGHVLVLDAGTTGVKAFVFNAQGDILAKAYRPLKKSRPKNGWVEQDPLEILGCCRMVIQEAVQSSAVVVSSIRGMGITNQREATVVWNRQTGKPVYPMIGWEDQRTRTFCTILRKEHGKAIQEKTGLEVLPYFSASKLKWILERHDFSTLLFGTLDTWLLWNLCDEHPHLTDETNAARTLLYDIGKRKWDAQLFDWFGIRPDVLPRVMPSRSCFGHLAKDIIGKPISILAMCGDQQASTYAALRIKGVQKNHVTKVTYGTGVFLVQVIGRKMQIHAPFFTTLMPAVGKGSVFALEAKIEGSGETVTRLLKYPKSLERYFKNLTKKVNHLVVQLPVRPRQMVVDGGVARDGIVVEIQERATGIETCLQTPFDGTALGCALLVWDAVH